MKVKRSITIDKEIDDYFKQNVSINVSALANLLLKGYIEENKK